MSDVCGGAPTYSHGGTSNVSGGDLDKRDAVQTITDELWKTPLWWISEILPWSHSYEDKVTDGPTLVTAGNGPL
jgi:hypothetical protein